jgi:hypothetical protein
VPWQIKSIAQKDTNKGSGFVGFALKRIAIAIILIAVVVWAFSLRARRSGAIWQAAQGKKNRSAAGT